MFSVKSDEPIDLNRLAEIRRVKLLEILTAKPGQIVGI